MQHVVCGKSGCTSFDAPVARGTRTMTNTIHNIIIFQSCDYMTFLVVVGYIQEMTDGDYARRNERRWVRASLIVYVKERLQESKTESIMRVSEKQSKKSMLRQTCFMQHARTTE